MKARGTFLFSFKFLLTINLVLLSSHTFAVDSATDLAIKKLQQQQQLTQIQKQVTQPIQQPQQVQQPAPTQQAQVAKPAQQPAPASTQTQATKPAAPQQVQQPAPTQQQAQVAKPAQQPAPASTQTQATKPAAPQQVQQPAPTQQAQVAKPAQQPAPASTQTQATKPAQQMQQPAINQANVAKPVASQPVQQIASAQPQVLGANCGQFKIVKGNVQYLPLKTRLVTVAKPEDVICAGDIVASAADSRAKIKMVDGNELNISPNTRLVIEKYEYKPELNKKKVLLNIIYGKIRSTTARENMYNDKSSDGMDNSFQVKTKTAVAGVRGTDFLTSFDAATARTEIMTFKGTVEFGKLGVGGAITNTVKVEAGNRTEMLGTSAPLAPQPIPKTEFDKMNQDTKTNDSQVPGQTAANSSTQPAEGSAQRGPASTGSMIESSDMPTMNSFNGPGMTTARNLPPPDFSVIKDLLPPLPPPCEFCNSAIQSGPSRVIITVDVQ